MKSKEIKERIGMELGNYLSPLKFVFKKGDNQFVHQTEDVKYVFHLVLTNWKSYYSLDTFIFIRHNSVENILEQALGKSEKITMGNEIGIIYSSRKGKEVKHQDLSLSLLLDSDLNKAIETLKFYFDEIAKPYYDAFTTLNSIDEIFNYPPFDHSPAHIGGSFDSRCMKGLTIAKLVKKDSYRELKSIYDEAMKGTSEDSIRDYMRVKQYLDKLF